MLIANTILALNGAQIFLFIASDSAFSTSRKLIPCCLIRHSPFGTRSVTSPEMAAGNTILSYYKLAYNPYTDRIAERCVSLSHNLLRCVAFALRS